jgi:hypothetical protein
VQTKSSNTRSAADGRFCCKSDLSFCSKSDACLSGQRERVLTMMGRLKQDQEQLFYSFNLEEAVPEDHLVREIAAVLDLS